MKISSSPFFAVSAEELASGERLLLASLSAKTEKHLHFTCALKALKGGKILIGHGKDITAASWVEITEKDVSAFTYYEYLSTPLNPCFSIPEKHGLDICGTLSVDIAVNAFQGTCTLRIEAASNAFETKIPGWDGCNGEIFAQVQGTKLENCTLSWHSDGLARKLWILGDSFVGLTSPTRWPYYLLKDGYSELMISGFPGMGSTPAIEQFRIYTEKACPAIAVWALGMNNGDTDEKINENYLCATKEFLSICEKKRITPILSTIPNTPVVNNRYKNEWVRSLPHRYIDFASAVGSDETEDWYEEMLAEDKVHPDVKGAQALYRQLLSDLPELADEKKENQMKDAKELFKKALEKKEITIKLLGDSITHGVGGTGWEMKGEPIVGDFKRSPDSFCWAKLFADHMKEAYGASVINNGCTGTTIQFIIEHFDALVSDTDDLCICTIGTNNRHMYKELGDRASREEWGKAFYDYVLQLNQMFEVRGKAVIFVANLPAAKENEQDGDTYYRILHMDDINEIYKRASKKAGFALISMYDLVSAYVKEKGILVDDILVDGLHPSDEGYKVMFTKLKEALGA
ncbi:MAG: SGNH/GDSL hydrolase family protein [Clostridia bacterium]|nr:SGNH/GDSL hydrolase family protein [Clostridia bacterium]